jgi:hypothetical protein
MKTKDELLKRLLEIKLELDHSRDMFVAYGNLETKMNDWEGKTKELEKLSILREEEDFINKIINYLF